MASISEAVRPRRIGLLVTVAALGYFVDMYDLLLFGIVRTESLMSLGYAGPDLTRLGIYLLNVQMVGMLLGGILWGVLGDRRGRISVLFGSIIAYSVANLLNGMVQNLDQYAALRFLAGIGLAGELGAGVTLVAESMSKETRGWGTMTVAGFGVAGTVAASLVGDLFEWRTAYFVGGGLGLLSLFLRIGIYESGMFSALRTTNVRKGAFFALFTSPRRAIKYLACILMGVPTWFVVGILIILSPELTKELGIVGEVRAGRAIFFTYFGLVVGDFASGILSQIFRSRKKVILGFILALLVGSVLYLQAQGISATAFYGLCFFLGVTAGYWALFVTNGSEQFGTNLRATVTTTVPNFVRGAVVPITLGFQWVAGRTDLITGAYVVGFACVVVALLSLAVLPETFGKDLDYTEDI